MKIALVYPYSKRNVMGCNPPISLLYVASSLKQSKEDVLVIDADDGKLSSKDILKKLVEYSPDLVGIPLFSTNLPAAYDLIQLLASGKFGWKILAGGPHSTIRAQDVLDTFKGCDYVLRGEAENSIKELVKCLQANNRLDSVTGLSYREGELIVHNPDSSVNMNLDSIPFPARELLSSAYKNNTYWRIGQRRTTDVIITSRGCPYNCNFCFKIANKFRVRSPENVLEELIQIRSFGTRNVHIMDDIFVFKKDRCLEILKMIKKEKLGIEFKVRARVDCIDRELLLAMKDSGVKSVVYGIESGSQKILDLMNKRTTVEMNYKAIAMTKKAGLQCYADIFIGYLGETPETIAMTEEFILKSKPTAVNISYLYPLPNTEVYNQAKRDGILRDDWSIKSNAAWVQLPWIKSREELYPYGERMLKKYVRNPVVIFNVIRHILFKIDFKQFKMLVNYFLKYAFIAPTK